VNSRPPTRRWRNKYPVMRVLAAFTVVPPLSNFMLIAINRLWVLTRPLPFGKAEPLVSFDWILVAIICAVPGYIAFLLLGVRSLYLLYRMKWSGFVLFAVLGTCYTFLTVVAWECEPSPSLVGAINGIVT
jgi:hypothetical protein